MERLTGRTGGPPPLQTVDRALEILLSFSEHRTEWGVFELADEFGLNKSTSQRLLAALAVRGFLKSDPITRRYSLGPAMWQMASLWERGGGLARLAEQVLADLAERTGRTALFSVPDGFHVRCIAAVDGYGGPVRIHPLVGDLYPAHAGATSRAYFAFLDPHVRRNLLSGRPFARYSELTEVDEGALMELFDQTVRTGWASSDGEYDPTTRAVAAPVRIHSRPVGSLTILEPKVVRFDDDLTDHIETLLAAAEQLAALLTPQRPTPRRRSARTRSAVTPTP
ncbi:IclR family transcriptional regulator [Microlunatus endophyticus]|uniref:IclR family transcriptional regulator n=1 Tax=Microlunatus endophyticus TaxID=1716077 RepID=A0A917SIA5_9ACTN|nr:IclR family transcriptional regulator [Microlunatus endophyticus]GGL82505.1 IclR family transcriptional regulator [Microlunatus endophyticus]